MNKLLIKIITIIFAIVLLFLAGAFISRIFLHNHVDNKIVDEVQKLTPGEVIQINILNSTDKSGIADKARRYMRSRGFDVVEIGNYPEPQKKSMVIDRVGDRASAEKVAKAIGVADSMIVTKIDSSLFIRASIILGSDFNLLYSFR